MRRSEVPAVGDEKGLLVGMLDVQRAAVLARAAGLDALALRTPLAPSALTLAGLLKHLTMVEIERVEGDLLGRPLGGPWADGRLDADPDWAFTSALEDDPEALRRAYRTACARSNELLVDVDLDAETARPAADGSARSARWVVVHLIQETARHAGHADLLREAIDGTTGV